MRRGRNRRDGRSKNSSTPRVGCGNGELLNERESMGLFSKYLIQKRDGTPVNPRAEYFVLRVDNFQHDERMRKASQEAMLTYAKQIERFDAVFAKQIRERIAEIRDNEAREPRDSDYEFSSPAISKTLRPFHKIPDGSVSPLPDSDHEVLPTDRSDFGNR